MVGAAEEVEVDVGAELVHGAVFVFVAEGSCDAVDALRCRCGAVGWEVHTEVVHGPRVIRFNDDARSSTASWYLCVASSGSASIQSLRSRPRSCPVV